MSRPYALELVTAPTDSPVDFIEAKAHLKGEDDADDALIGLYLNAARDAGQIHTGYAFGVQSYQLTLDCFPYYGDGGDSRQGIKLPWPPLQSVTSIYYYDTNGVRTLLASTEYQVDSVSKPGWVFPAVNKSWPSTQSGKSNAVEVTFKCGFSTTTDAPAGVRKIELPARWRDGLLMFLGHLYAHRESVIIGSQPIEVPQSALALWDMGKVMKV